MRAHPDPEQAAVLDVGGEDRPAGEHECVVGVPQPVRAAPGGARPAVAVDDPVGRDVDHAERERVLLGGDDPPAVRREKRVVGHGEAPSEP